jgi:hypothetical protein
MNTTIFRIESPLVKFLGKAGLLFFLVKGLVWLAVPVVMYLLHHAF